MPGARGYVIRYFSPKAEVPFCGHATVATALALAERGGPGEPEFTTRAGAVPVSVVREDGELRATLAGVEPHIEELSLVPETVELTLHQGEDMGRPGTLTVTLRAGDARVRVSGSGARLPEPA